MAPYRGLSRAALHSGPVDELLRDLYRRFRDLPETLRLLLIVSALGVWCLYLLGLISLIAAPRLRQAPVAYAETIVVTATLTPTEVALTATPTLTPTVTMSLTVTPPATNSPTITATIEPTPTQAPMYVAPVVVPLTATPRAVATPARKATGKPGTAPTRSPTPTPTRAR